MTSAHIARSAVGIIGDIISCFLFLSPMPTFVRICKKGSVEQYSATPYLATFVNCMAWVLYALPMVQPDNLLVVTMEGVGCVIEFVYVAIFLIYSEPSKRLRVALWVLVELIFIATLTFVALDLVHTAKTRSLIVGITCVVLSTIMYASPLAVMKLVMTTKSVEYMPFSLTLASFVSGVAWTIYALIRFDPFILIPNGLGTVFSVIQLILYATYYKRPKQAESDELLQKTPES